MDNHRLKIKIGEFEFEAEGTPESVDAQFQAFRQLAETMANVKPPKTPEANGSEGETTPPKNPAPSVDTALNKIMKVQNRVVSLTVNPPTPEDAALLLLYGQLMLRNNEHVTGSEIVDGLTATGGIDIGRSERLFEKVARSGDIVMNGERRGKRYRLTNAGINKARQIAANMIALVSY